MAADTYGVTADDVAGELSNLFGAAGFTGTSTPTEDAVEGWITEADVLVTLHVQRAAAKVPKATDQARPLAVRFILAWVKAEVLRAKYTGQAPDRVAAAAKPYDDQATRVLEAIDELGEQMTGTAVVTSRVKSSAETDPRELLVTDCQLGPTSTRARVPRY